MKNVRHVWADVFPGGGRGGEAMDEVDIISKHSNAIKDYSSANWVGAWGLDILSLVKNQCRKSLGISQKIFFKNS